MNNQQLKQTLEFIIDYADHDQSRERLLKGGSFYWPELSSNSIFEMRVDTAATDFEIVCHARFAAIAEMDSDLFVPMFEVINAVFNGAGQSVQEVAIEAFTTVKRQRATFARQETNNLKWARSEAKLYVELTLASETKLKASIAAVRDSLSDLNLDVDMFQAHLKAGDGAYVEAFHLTRSLLNIFRKQTQDAVHLALAAIDLVDAEIVMHAKRRETEAAELLRAAALADLPPSSEAEKARRKSVVKIIRDVDPLECFEITGDYL